MNIDLSTFRPAKSDVEGTDHGLDLSTFRPAKTDISQLDLSTFRPAESSSGQGLIGAINVIKKTPQERPSFLNMMLESSETVPEILQPSHTQALEAYRKTNIRPSEALRAEELVRETETRPKKIKVPAEIPEREVGALDELGYQKKKLFKNIPPVSDVKESLERLAADEYNQITDKNLRERLYAKDLEKVSEWKLSQKTEESRKRTFPAKVVQFAGETLPVTTKMGAILTAVEMGIPISKTASLGVKAAQALTKPLLGAAISIGIDPDKISSMRPPEYDVVTDEKSGKTRVEIKDFGDDELTTLLGKAFLDEYLAFSTAHLGAKYGGKAEVLGAKQIAKILPAKTVDQLKKAYVAGGGKLTEEALEHALQTGAVGGEVGAALHDLGRTVINLPGEDKDLGERMSEYVTRRTDPKELFSSMIALSFVPAAARGLTLERGRRALRADVKGTVSEAAAITREIAPDIVGPEKAAQISDSLFAAAETTPSRKSLKKQDQSKGKVLGWLDTLADTSDVYATKEQAGQVLEANPNIATLKAIYRELSGSEKKSDQFLTRLLNIGEELEEGGRTAEHLLKPRETEHAIQEPSPETIHVRETPGDSGKMGGRDAEKEAPPQSLEIRQSEKESRTAQEASKDLDQYKEAGGTERQVLGAKKAVKQANALSGLYSALDSLVKRASESLDAQETAITKSTEYKNAGDEVGAKRSLAEANKHGKAYSSFAEEASKINQQIREIEESRKAVPQEPTPMTPIERGQKLQEDLLARGEAEKAGQVGEKISLLKKKDQVREIESQVTELRRQGDDLVNQANTARENGQTGKARILDAKSREFYKRAELLENKPIEAPKKTLLARREDIGKRPVVESAPDTSRKLAESEYRKQGEPGRIVGTREAVADAIKSVDQKTAESLTETKIRKEDWGKTYQELQRKAEVTTSPTERAKYQSAAKYASDKHRNYQYLESFHEEQIRSRKAREIEKGIKAKEKVEQATKEAKVGKIEQSLKNLGIPKEAAKEAELSIKARISNKIAELKAKTDKVLNDHKATIDDIKAEIERLKREKTDQTSAIKYAADYISKKIAGSIKTVEGKEVPIKISPSYMKSINRILAGVDSWTSMAKALDKIDDLAERSARRVYVREIVKSLSIARNENTQSNKNVIRPLIEKIKSQFYNQRISEESLKFYEENKGKKLGSVEDQERFNRIEQRLKDQEGKRYFGDLSTDELQELQRQIVEADALAREKWKYDQEQIQKQVKGDTSSIASRKNKPNQATNIAPTREDMDWYLRHKDKELTSPEDIAKMAGIKAKLEGVKGKGKAREFWDRFKKNLLFLNINRHMLDYLDNNPRGEQFTGPISRIFGSDNDVRQDTFVRRKINYLVDGLDAVRKKHGALTRKEAEQLHRYALLQQKNGERYLVYSGEKLGDIEAARTISPKLQAYYDYMRSVYDVLGKEAQKAAGEHWSYDMKLEPNYFPIQYEPITGEIADYRKARKLSLSPSGAMLSRIGPSKDRKLKLNAIDAFKSSVEDMLYQVEVRPYLKYLYELTGDKDFKSAVGDMNQEILADWVKRADVQWRVPAQYKTVMGKLYGNMIRLGRRGLLVFSPKTLFKMMTGSIQTPLMYGSKNSILGTLDVTDVNNIHWLKSNFPEIFERLSTGGVQVEERAIGKMERLGYKALGYGDVVAVWPATFAAIRKWHEDRGMTPDYIKPIPRAAKDYVNTSINEMFGTTTARERSRLVTGGESARFWRDWTALGSFMQTMSSTMAHATLKRPPPLALQMIGSIYATFMIDKGLDLLFSTKDYDDGEWLGEVVRDAAMYPLEGYPLVYNAMNMMRYGYDHDYAFPVGISTSLGVTKELKYMKQSRSDAKKEKHFILMLLKAGEAGGIPLKGVEQLYKAANQ